MNNDLFNQVFAAVGDNASSGAQATGQVADWLIGAGLSVAAITQMLNGVATSAAATPDQIAYVQNEMRYLQTYQQPRTNWLGLAVLVGVVAWVASRE